MDRLEVSLPQRPSPGKTLCADNLSEFVIDPSQLVGVNLYLRLLAQLLDEPGEIVRCAFKIDTLTNTEVVGAERHVILLTNGAR
jgi:hypothetical protein